MDGPDRHGFARNRTDRPDRASGIAAVLPTIADVLRLDVVARAAPEVIAGESGLERPVRWVHVTETASVSGLVSGGELLLSTGVGWPGDDAGLARYGVELHRAGIAGLVLELGRRYTEAPAALTTACAEHGIPLIVLHREARFIAITEAVHSRIISDQMTALRARDDVHELFTELSLRGSPADFIVEQLGRTLAAPVVLEDLAHRVIATSQELDPGLLADWEQAARTARREEADGWLAVPVEARGTRWGHLVALPGPPHPAGRAAVLEQGAIALALSRLADADDGEWLRRSHQTLLASLLGGRYRSEAGLRARFEAAGLPFANRRLAGVAIVGSSGVPSVAQVRDAARDIGSEAVAGADPDAPGLLMAILSSPARHGGDRAEAFARSLAAMAGIRDLTIALGSEARDIRGVLASLDEARELAARGERTSGPTVRRTASRPLWRLMASFADDPRVQEHSERMLQPLIDHDLATGGDLLDVLAAYAAHPGNRTRAARASHLSRSVFYQRIALIEQLLDADLDDGETVSALHAALTTWRLARR